jgi:hypothetical protein
MYEPAWVNLKTSLEQPKRIVIAAPAKFHPRIYKAIIKEKDMDVVFKLQLSDVGKIARLSKESRGGKLTIFLTYHIPISELF